MNRNRIALLPLLALALTLVGAPSALAITRESVALRAQSWVDRPVRYSQARHHLGYRTDCSGYVSMCWDTGFSWSTRTFSKVTHRIAVADLKPGDAMLKKGYHIRLFEGWTDDTHTAYVAYEAGSGTVAVRHGSVRRPSRRTTRSKRRLHWDMTGFRSRMTCLR